VEAGASPARSRHCDRPLSAESQTLPATKHVLKRGRDIPKEFDMTTSTLAPAARPVAIPIRELLPWVIFAGLICLLGVYFVGAEEGATSIIKGMYVHEFVHDGRHLLGFPCH
jgi:hypothetical protein